MAALDVQAEAEGRARAEVVRDAVLDRLRTAAQAREAAAYEQAYRDLPGTDDELARAQGAALRLTSDEAWEPWW